MSRPTHSTAVARPATPRREMNVARRWGPLLRERIELDIHFEPRSNRAAFAICFPLLGAAQLLGLFLEGPWALQAAPALVALWGLTHLRERRASHRRRMGRLPVCAGSDLTDEAVRIVGTIEIEAEPFAVIGGAAPAVYARTFFRRDRGDGRADVFIREEIRGVPFLLRRADGVAFRVDPGSVWLLDREQPLSGVSAVVRVALGAPTRGLRQQIHQATLSPGDLVEAVGRIAREVNPGGAAAPGRGTPMVQKLVPAWDNGVWIRRLTGLELRASAPALPSAL